MSKLAHEAMVICNQISQPNDRNEISRHIWRQKWNAMHLKRVLKLIRNGSNKNWGYSSYKCWNFWSKTRKFVREPNSNSMKRRRRSYPTNIVFLRRNQEKYQCLKQYLPKIVLEWFQILQGDILFNPYILKEFGEVQILINRHEESKKRHKSRPVLYLLVAMK